MPKISVIMPAYNAEKYIAEAIDSILDQTFGDFEFIILNDCSKDRTEEIILSYADPRIVYVKNEENMGVARTLNRGLDMAKGEYIARMDADDISLPERFIKQVNYLDKHKNVAICGCNALVFGRDFQEHPHLLSKNDSAIRADQLFNPAFVHPSVMMRASMIQSAGGGYDDQYEKAEDYEFWYRLLSVGKGHNLQQALLRYRHHGGQVTVTHKKEQQEAVLQLHRRMLTDMKAQLTETEIQVFLQLCAGERCFTQDDYTNFISGGKKIIVSANGYETTTKKTYSLLNLSVIEKSKLKNPVYFSWREPAYKLINKFRKHLR